jgi:predicted transcriptional regulator
MGVVREEARKILDNLPDEASWNDLMYEMYVRKKIDEGIKAADEGRLVEHEKVKIGF